MPPLSAARRRRPLVERLEERAVPATIPYNVPTGTAGNSPFSGAIGLDFDVQQQLVVTHLGAFDHNSDGPVFPLNVRLYDRDTQTILASLRFDGFNPGALLGGSRFGQLTAPLVLAPGFHGTIVAEGYGFGELGGDLAYGPLPIATDDGNGAVSFIGSRTGGTGTFPTNVDIGFPAAKYAAGTLLFAKVVPDTVFYDPSWAGLPARTVVDVDGGTPGVQPGLIGFDAFAAPGDAHGLVFVDDDWDGLSNGTVVDCDLIAPGLQPATVGTDAFATLNDGTTAVATNGAVVALAGTYAESLSLTRPVALLGAQRGKNVNTRFGAFVAAKADPTIESVITPDVNDPAGANDLVRVLADGVAVDGFTIDGNNPALGGSSVVSGGVPIHARHGVVNATSSGTPFAADQFLLKDSIIQNLAGGAARFDNGGVASSGGRVQGNLARNVAASAVLFLGHDAYADVVGNTVYTHANQTGLSVEGYSSAGIMTWSANEIWVNQDSLGLNVFDINGANISLAAVGNTINALPGVFSVGTRGLYVGQVIGSATVQLADNLIGTSVGSGYFGRAADFWNLPTFTTVRIAGGTLNRALVGVQLDNVDPRYGAAPNNTLLEVEQVTITAGEIGVKARAVPQPVPPLSGSNDVSGDVRVDVVGGFILGCGDGVRVTSVGGYNNGHTAYARLRQDFGRNLPGPTLRWNTRGVVVEGSEGLGFISDSVITDNAVGIAVYGAHARAEYNNLRNNYQFGVDIQYGSAVDLGGGSHSGLGFGLGGNGFDQGYSAAGAKAIRNLNPRSPVGYGPLSFPTDVTAVHNNFGPVGLGAVEGMIWHNTDDPSVGFVFYNNENPGYVAPAVESVTPFVSNVTAEAATGQRSMIKQIRVVINAPVLLSAGAFTLTRTAPASLTWYSGSLPVGSFAPRVVSSSIDGTTGKTTVILDFVGSPAAYREAVGGSLIDGRYTLSFDGTKAAAGYAGSGNLSQSSSSSFFRLFGDANGDGRVDAVDNNLYNTYKNTPSSVYFTIFDFDCSGGSALTAAVDRAQFNKRYNKGQIF